MPPSRRLICLAALAAWPMWSAGQTDASTLPIQVNVVNPEDLLDSNKTVVIPTVYLTLLVDGRVAATKQSGLFSGGNNSAKASASYQVEGLDKAFAQQLAQAAYDDAVTRLRAAGYTVLTWADIKDRDMVRGLARDTSTGPMGLPTVSEGGNNYVIATPSDEQFFKKGLGGGWFAEFQQGGKNRFTDATLIIPTYTIHAPQAWTGTSAGYKSISAEANVAEGMNLWVANAHWMGQPKSRMMRGIPGVATKQQVINVTEKAGTVTKVADTTPQTANALSGLLGALTGTGSISASSGQYKLTIDREAYTQGVMNGVRAFNAELAKAAAEAKP
ncbi:hypothetical protein KAK07_10170 [Ideonella sp. 4Y16]|uniref:Uncharacterized protein n=1 Tax=Ideonella alba TaxID=2824118 RepID=A0A940Y937_9BURK|nr:hypothetical protein [Ideonella alba]MBQ0932197.1 hypothetical protein [Ideonella alba]MBQ0943702.1 hypothetical protein [Ideonella alba]